jgi:eukaryotic-like serine/threonine-protein kinase
MPVVDSRLAGTKGLAAYTKEDADIFLSLLPGPFDRDGLPPTISFWKSRIESTDPEVAFRVGVMYGVSGCGKSSLLQAGLLPHLGAQVLAIYIKATADKTEVELLNNSANAFPDLGRGGSPMPPLPECLARLRDGDLLPPRRKVLLVLDQFEQWLHAHRREPVTQLIEALRHCDGVRVQAMVCVRDGFMVSVNRFLRALELEVDGERNYRMVDLFEKPHAHKVLKMLGQAHRKVSLPPTPEQEQFLEQVVERLTEKDGRVPSIQLVVVASIMKSYDWVPAELDRLGGVEAIGWRFLQESFEGRGAPELNRLHQDAAARVLEELLPPLGEDIKRRCSLATIRRASRYGDKKEDQDNFAQLMRILEHDLRLITPVESHAEILETAASETPSFDAQSVSSDGEGSYQLTHDFLVQAVRDWIDLRDGRTRQGRARRILRQRAGLVGGERVGPAASRRGGNRCGLPCSPGARIGTGLSAK